MSKCGASVAKFTNEADANERTIQTQAETDVAVVSRDEFSGKASSIPMVDPYSDSRALGVQASLAGFAADAVGKAKEEADVTARAIAQMPRGSKLRWLAHTVGRAVGWARLRYRLMFVYAWPEQVERAAMQLRKAVVGRMGLHPGAARAAVDTMVWMDAER